MLRMIVLVAFGRNTDAANDCAGSLRMDCRSVREGADAWQRSRRILGHRGLGCGWRIDRCCDRQIRRLLASGRRARIRAVGRGRNHAAGAVSRTEKQERIAWVLKKRESTAEISNK